MVKPFKGPLFASAPTRLFSFPDFVLFLPILTWFIPLYNSPLFLLLFFFILPNFFFWGGAGAHYAPYPDAGYATDLITPVTVYESTSTPAQYPALCNAHKQGHS